MEKLLKNWKRETAEKLFNAMLEGTFFEISSTEVKNSMEKNCFQSHIIKEERFPSEIADYIRQHNLYQHSEKIGKGKL